MWCVSMCKCVYDVTACANIMFACFEYFMNAFVALSLTEVVRIFRGGARLPHSLTINLSTINYMAVNLAYVFAVLFYWLCEHKNIEGVPITSIYAFTVKTVNLFHNTLTHTFELRSDPWIVFRTHDVFLIRMFWYIKAPQFNGFERLNYKSINQHSTT